MKKVCNNLPVLSSFLVPLSRMFWINFKYCSSSWLLVFSVPSLLTIEQVTELTFSVLSTDIILITVLLVHQINASCKWIVKIIGLCEMKPFVLPELILTLATWSNTKNTAAFINSPSQSPPQHFVNILTTITPLSLSFTSVKRSKN